MRPQTSALFAVTLSLAAGLCVHGFHAPVTRPLNDGPSSIARCLPAGGNEGSIEHTELPQSRERRRLMQQSSAAVASLLLPISSYAPAALADGPSDPYTRSPQPNDKFQFGYTITPPPSFAPGNKPLKTHLDEINFSPEGVRGYTLGITVDPVRISSIRDFGTPEEVAARVVTAEVNRDGVFDVKLARDAAEDAEAGCYDVEYISDGKRGTKRFVTRIYIKDGFLYVLTVQSKEAEYDKVREGEVMACVKSFRPL